MRVTSKGQVTIPKEVRTALGILPGSEVRFVIDGDGAKLYCVDVVGGESRGQRTVRVLRELGERLRSEGQISDLTTDEIMAMTRGRGE